jgi:arylsulfatase A-like enzyme
MRSILFLSDTVNRRFMDMYSSTGLHLPNIDRLAARSVTFTNHWTGSAPCMPARRDLMTGRLNFLERNWGPIEAFDWTLPQALRKEGIRSHIITDHYHYLETGGENYLQMFDSWVMNRGQEWDPCVSMLKKKDIPEHYGKIVPQYWYNRDAFKDDESRYPSAMTIQGAADWLEENHSEDDFLLWVEPFDPHEPFEVPQKYLDMIGNDYDGTLYFWPEYKQVDRAGITPEALQHIRKRYLALLLMTDEWLGKLLDVMDRHDMWKDTLLIYTTDHGYMLGEHGYMAKNYMPAYNEVYHIPLIVHMPGDASAGKRIDALTQNIDVMPTLLEYYGIGASECRNKLHGKSWLPLIRGEKETVRDCAIYGYFGKQMNITDGRYTYFRSPNEKNRPLNIYTSMPTDVYVYYDCERIKDFSQVQNGPFLSWNAYPVYKIPADAINDNDDGTLRYVYLYDWEKADQLYDLETDYAQERNLVDEQPETVKRLEDMMCQALMDHDAPAEHFERMRLK